MCVHGSGRGPEEESLKQTPVSVEPEAGLSLTTLRSRPELKPSVGHSTN